MATKKGIRKSSKRDTCRKCAKSVAAIERLRQDLGLMKRNLAIAEAAIEDTRELEAQFDEERENWNAREERLRDQLRAANRRAPKNSTPEFRLLPR